MRVYCCESTLFFVFARLPRNCWWLLRTDSSVCHQLHKSKCHLTPWWVCGSGRCCSTPWLTVALQHAPVVCQERNTLCTLYLVLSGFSTGLAGQSACHCALSQSITALLGLCILAHWSLTTNYRIAICLLNKCLLFPPTAIHSLPLQRYKNRRLPIKHRQDSFIWWIQVSSGLILYCFLLNLSSWNAIFILYI